jgi:hypothetical protein
MTESPKFVALHLVLIAPVTARGEKKVPDVIPNLFRAKRGLATWGGSGAGRARVRTPVIAMGVSRVPLGT